MVDTWYSENYINFLEVTFREMFPICATFATYGKIYDNCGINNHLSLPKNKLNESV